MQPKMQPYVPRRIKRFQSYSMTPIDSYWQNQSQSNNMSFSVHNKINNIPCADKLEQHIIENERNIDTNQFSLKMHSKVSALNSFAIQNSFKNSNQPRNEQYIQTPIKNNTFCKQNGRKLSSSNIYDFSSISGKPNSFRGKTMKQSMFLPTNENSDFVQCEKFENNLSRADVKRKQVRIPSFLLGKKKKDQSNGEAQPNVFQKQTASSNYLQHQPRQFATEQKLSFKKQKIYASQKTVESDSNRSLFSPPSISKISFSKDTASTICTILPRNQSRATFKDQDDDEQHKEKSLMYNQSNIKNAHSLKDQVQNLFQEQSSLKRRNTLQNEIAQLFSDQEDDKQQFNQEILNQFAKLF